MKNNSNTVSKLIFYIASLGGDKVGGGEAENGLAAKYSHVWANVLDYWGTELFSSYMNELIIVDGRVSRDGFSPEALLEVMRLITAHDKIYPDLRKSKTGVFK